METLICEMKVCRDNSGLLDDATAGLASASRRHRNSKTSAWAPAASKPSEPCWRTTPSC
ncbi:MAG: hypothetical protein KGZ46_04255 [Hydrogenophaga sp.]|nr:hypothetical protein [Hydrogenophaga sp.]